MNFSEEKKGSEVLNPQTGVETQRDVNRWDDEMEGGREPIGRCRCGGIQCGCVVHFFQRF